MVSQHFNEAFPKETFNGTIKFEESSSRQKFSILPME